VHGHTGANVYKGMVGLYPIYDPYDGGFDMGDETKGLRLPGQRVDHGDGSFDVDYDIPMALYDVGLDDGVTPHKDFHNGNGEAHPEWWGMHYFRHFPNHGFVGDIFTVNGKAYPVLTVKRRKYRLRFLGASISRVYELSLMRSVQGPVAARDLGLIGDELQGQYRLPDGERVMQFMQIASEGGLLPHPMPRDSFEIWPAVRREFVVDFTKYANGAPTAKGDVIYMVNTMKMTTGRIWDPADPAYKVPMLKIVIGDDADDQSVMPKPTDTLRPLPARKFSDAEIGALAANADVRGRVFKLERTGGVLNQPETEWVINGLPFDATGPLATMTRGEADVWMIENGGGGWIHPMHLHQEEHHVISRNGTPSADARHPDDTGKMDVVSLDPSESVAIYRQFRTFTGPYVAHCHNLAHEDHNMMFGWEILPAPGDPGPDQSPLPGGNPGGNPGDGAGDATGATGAVGAVGAVGATGAGGGAAGGAPAAGGTTNSGGKGRKPKKTVATLGCRLTHKGGRRIVRLKVTDSRAKAKERLTIHIRHAGKDVSVLHRFLHKGHETIDVPLSRTLRGRYDIVVVLDDRTTVRRTITIR
jgi:FtsP/CotA-like multicopper oxidase with cupredoxin domain